MDISPEGVSGANKEFYSRRLGLSLKVVDPIAKVTPMTIVDPDVEAASTLARPDYALADALWADRGQVFLSGNQALVRLLLMQRAADEARGLDTRGFVSGYRGSPLG